MSLTDYSHSFFPPMYPISSPWHVRHFLNYDSMGSLPTGVGLHDVSTLQCWLWNKNNAESEGRGCGMHTCKQWKQWCSIYVTIQLTNKTWKSHYLQTEVSCHGHRRESEKHKYFIQEEKLRTSRTRSAQTRSEFAYDNEVRANFQTCSHDNKVWVKLE